MLAVKKAGLGLGQRYFWLHHYQLPPQARHDTHIVIQPPVPEGTPLLRIRGALNCVVRRHEALRTTFHTGPGGLPEQRVHPPGPLLLRVATAEKDGTPAPDEVIGECTEADFDLTAEWPVRACVVTEGGTPRRLVLVLAHVAFDDQSVDILLHEFSALLAGAAGGRPAALPAVLWQPSDVARAEAAETGAAGPERLRFWREQVAALPSDVYAGRRRPQSAGPTAASAALTSPRLLDAARAIADRYRTWPSTVYFAAYAAAMSGYCGTEQVPFWLFTSRRGEAASMSVMTCMFAPMLVTADLGGDPPFSEVLRRTGDAVDTARSRPPAGYDEMVDLLAAEGFRRHHPVRVEADVNLLNYAPRGCGTRRTRFTWHPEPAAWADSGSDSYFRVYEWADGVTVALRVVTAVMSAETLRAFLRGYEQLVLAHAESGTDLRLSRVTGLLSLPGRAAPPSAERPPAGDGSLERPAAGEAALGAAIAEANRLPAVDVTACYAVAGGRALCAPLTLELLRERGWSGLTVSRLNGSEPIRELARQLAPMVTSIYREKDVITRSEENA